ncbi:MAG: prepilin-type N-terminal cleavage/methylation domain-containing protein [Candidatus Shapirobacteria bacterium]|jgi:type II secretion system protein G
MIKISKNGFTLIELLVVITIMGILTIITASQFTLARKRAADSQRKTDISSVAKALQMYYADYGKYPIATDLEGGRGLNVLWGLELKDLTGYTYMKVVPKENILPSPTQYCYVVSPDQKKFSLYTILENTNDPECLKDGSGDLLYTACGRNNAFCFAISSVNNDPLDPDLTIY